MTYFKEFSSNTKYVITFCVHVHDISNLKHRFPKWCRHILEESRTVKSFVRKNGQ